MRPKLLPLVLLVHALLAPALPAQGGTLELAVESWDCSVAILDATGTTVTVHYAGLPANQPASGGNFVALWQSSMVAWPVDPVASTPVLQNSESGTLVLTGVSITTVAYTVAYAVGPRVADVCASAELTPQGRRGARDAVGMTITAVGSNSLSIHYRTLAGYLPARSGNWIGLWRGRVSPYYAPDPLATLAIPHDVTEDDVSIEGVQLQVGTTYTLVYFMGPEASTAAVMIYFTTPPAAVSEAILLVDPCTGLDLEAAVVEPR